MWTPKPEEDGYRRYCRWGGNPKGTREDKTRCIVTVADGGRSVLSHQCNKKRGHGPNDEYCAQHAKKVST